MQMLLTLVLCQCCLGLCRTCASIVAQIYHSCHANAVWVCVAHVQVLSHRYQFSTQDLCQNLGLLGRMYKADHTYRICKFIRVNGQQLYAAMWDVQNEYGEIVWMEFTCDTTMEERVKSLVLLIERQGNEARNSPQSCLSPVN